MKQERKQHNCIYAENQKEYKPLPALKIEGADGQVVTCWGFSLKERLRVLFVGKLWVSQLTFSKGLISPMLISTKQSDHFTDKNTLGDKAHRWYERVLPLYFPKNRGIFIAIWNCGMRPQTLWQAVKDTRITIRQETKSKNRVLMVIKKGDI